jgi:hypothetical protein
MFHRIGRDREERTSDSSFTGELATSDGINRHPTTVGGIFDREPQFEVERNFSKSPSFHPEKTDLVVILPGDIIRRADMNIFWF